MSSKMKFSVRLSLVTLATVVILISGGLISFIYYYGSKHSMHALVDSMMQKICNHAIDKTISHLHSASINAEVTEFMLSEGVIQATNRDIFIKNFHSIVEANPQFVSILYGEEKTGDFIMVKKMPNGTISAKVMDRKNGKIEIKWIHETEEYKKTFPDSIIEDGSTEYDPRTRPWYKDAKDKKDHVWTDVYTFDMEKTPGLTYSTPIYDKNKELIGVMGIDISIAEISYFLGSFKIGKSGKAFIVNHDYKIVAHPLLANEKFHELDESGHDEEDHELINSINEFRIRAKNIDLESLKKEPYFFTHTHEGETHLNMYYDFPGETYKWMIAVVVPEDDFMEDIKKNNRIIMVLSAFLIVIAVTIGFVLSRKISRPLSLLEKEMDNIKTFQLDSKIEVQSSLLEVDNMARSFDNMKRGLQSFKKYVPADLVRQLMSMGKEAVLGGERRALTIYFSDIASFTSISESLKPEELVELLGEYMDSCSRTIIDNQGTIDKYIGDAIMAFWGAPSKLEDHAVKACLSAIKVKRNRKALEEKWSKEGKPIMKDRIGINSGDVIVGNIGSDTRMNYTVIGDSVNLASRIEGLNKYYGTEVMISESTYQLAKEHIEARQIDYVAVKGKSSMVAIYELISEKDNIDATTKELVRIFEEGLNLYRKKEWTKAIEKFNVCLKLNSNDTPSKVFIERCKEYQIEPPPTNWDGVYRMKSK